jgi:hypothetical protein
MTSQEKAVNQTGFSRAISTEDKGEWTDRKPLGFSEGFEVPEAEAGEHIPSSWIANGSAGPGQRTEIGVIDGFGGEF